MELAALPPVPKICDHRGCEDMPGIPVQCRECGKVYQRCGFHGGTDGARRSLNSHRGLTHSEGSK